VECALRIRVDTSTAKAEAIELAEKQHRIFEEEKAVLSSQLLGLESSIRLKQELIKGLARSEQEAVAQLQSYQRQVSELETEVSHLRKKLEEVAQVSQEACLHTLLCMCL
jgi:prefoldin subunit 5